MFTYQTVELYCGVGAWTLNLYGRTVPIPRLGKNIHRTPRVTEIFGTNFETFPKQSLVIDADLKLCTALNHLFGLPHHLAQAIRQIANDSADVDENVLWYRAKQMAIYSKAPAINVAAAWWIWAAGARQKQGGGFRGHFTPTIDNLIKRIEAFAPLPQVLVVCADVQSVSPFYTAETIVHMDSPARHDCRLLAQDWADEGCHVVVANRMYPWEGWEQIGGPGKQRATIWRP